MSWGSQTKIDAIYGETDMASDLTHPAGITVEDPGDPLCAHRWVGHTQPESSHPDGDTVVECADCDQRLRWRSGR